MATIKLKRGYDLKLLGSTSEASPLVTAVPTTVAITPDDFTGIVPRMEKKEGEHVVAGEPLYHDKQCERIKVVAPVAGVVKEVRRGERRKILAVIIDPDKEQPEPLKHNTAGASTLDTLLESGLWVMLRQRPYDVVPDPDKRPRDIFVTAFDSAPLATSLMKNINPSYLERGVSALQELTDGKVYVGFAPGEEIDIKGAECNTFVGPHPAGNAGVQVANVKPVNKGEVVWTLDVVTLARIGELFATGKVSHETVVTLAGEQVDEPRYVKTVCGADIQSIVGKNIKGEPEAARIISGNVLTGNRVTTDQWLRTPYRMITAIPENNNPDEFMGWASMSPRRFSIYHLFPAWLCGKRKVSMDARLKGGERAIVRTGEYDRMLPMDILAEFLVKAVIAYDIDRMEQLGIYEVAPEDFALAEYADTSKLELQRIIREGLDRLRADME